MPVFCGYICCKGQVPVPGGESYLTIELGGPILNVTSSIFKVLNVYNDCNN